MFFAGCCAVLRRLWLLRPSVQSLAEGITKAGVKTEMVDVSFDPQVGGPVQQRVTSLHHLLTRDSQTGTFSCTSSVNPVCWTEPFLRPNLWMRPLGDAEGGAC